MSLGSGILLGIGIDAHPETHIAVIVNIINAIASLNRSFDFKVPTLDLYYIAVYKGFC